MMTLVRVVTFLHLAVYLGIMWYGWQSYKLLRKPSWKIMGIGFAVLLTYRLRQLTRQMMVDYPIDAENTFLPFVGALFLLAAFWMLSREHHDLIKKLSDSPPLLRAGAQPVEYWKDESRKMLEKFREIVREEIKAASGMTTVTVKGPSATLQPPVEESGP